MFRYIRYFVFSFICLQAAHAAPADDIADALARAESLYFEAKFRDVIHVLERADDVLRPKPDRVQDRITVKLQLALAHLGLNEYPQAKASLRELFGLDSEYRLDVDQFPPKFLVLADEARSEQNEIRCQRARSDARTLLEAGNATALLNIIQTMKSRCSALDALEPDTAQLFYKTALDSYKAGRFSDALEKFQITLKLAPKHELAVQYADLAQSKLQLHADRLLLDWRKKLEALEFRQAAATYGQLKASNDGASTHALEQMRLEYRNALTGMIELWNRACGAGDTATTQLIRQQLPESLPDPSLGDDILANMKTCNKKGCSAMNSQLVLARLKVQVNPVIPPVFQDAVRRSPITVRVKVRIDEKGDVTVLEGEAENNSVLTEAVRSAVERWKFTPIMDETGPHCVETEIPIVIKP